jgi:hypothetical protein
MKSWRIVFSRSFQLRNLDISKFNSRHQFHSFHRLDDWYSFSLLQQRYQTTIINGDTERNFTGIDNILQKLNDNVKKREFGKFNKHMEELCRTAAVSKAGISANQTVELISIMKEWKKANHSGEDYTKLLKSMAILKFSVFNAEQKEIIVAIVDKVLQRNQKSFLWFAFFLSAIKRLKYSGSLLTSNHRQRILKSLSELVEDGDERAYSELLSGIVGVEINWKEISEMGKRNLLKHMESKKEEFTADTSPSVLFNFGKLGVDLKETGNKKTVIELVEKALQDIAKDNGKGKLDLPRVVSLIFETGSF